MKMELMKKVKMKMKTRMKMKMRVMTRRMKMLKLHDDEEANTERKMQRKRRIMSKGKKE